MKTKYFRILLAILVFFNFAAAFVAAFELRTLFSDGSLWAFNIINTGHFNLDLNFLRYADALFQLPAVLAIKIGLTDSVALYLFSFSYELHPFVSLAVCWILLYRQKRTDLILFPLLSFACVTQTCLLTGFTLVAGMLSLMWPMLFILLFWSGKLFEKIAFSFLLAALLLEHETSLVFLFVLTLCFYKNRRALAGILIVSCLLMGVHILTLDSGPKVNFLRNLLETWSAFRISQAILVVIFALTCLVKPANKKAVVVQTLLVLGFYFSQRDGLNMIDSYNARTFAAVWASLICWLCVIQFKKNQNFSSGWIVVVAALVISFFHDWVLNANWHNTVATVQKYLEPAPLCRQLTPQQTKTFNFDNQVLPLFSIVYGAQLFGTPGTVLFDENYLNKHKAENLSHFCCGLANGKIHIGYGGYIELASDWRYDLKALQESAKVECINSRYRPNQ